MAGDADEDLKLLRGVLKAVGRADAWKASTLNREGKSEASKIVDRTSNLFPPVPFATLRTLLSSPRRNLDMLESGQFIYLEPVASRAGLLVPVLAATYDFEAHPAKASMRLAIFGQHDERLQAVGYRFEYGAGRHAYFHLQHVVDFGTSRPLPTATWMPVDLPAIPIDAKSPVGLVVCLLGGLYDDYLPKLLAYDELNLQRLKHRLGQGTSEFLERLTAGFRV